MAFRLFHGQNGVVPLSGSSFLHPQKSESEPSPVQFNPLAAKAATISLSGFGAGGPFGFDAFLKNFGKDNKKPKPSKKESSSKVKLTPFAILLLHHISYPQICS